MNRRRFLQMLSAGAFGAMTLDVEKLLWVPGAKTIFLPPVTRYGSGLMFHRDAFAFVMNPLALEDFARSFSVRADDEMLDIYIKQSHPLKVVYGLGTA